MSNHTRGRAGFRTETASQIARVVGIASVARVLTSLWIAAALPALACSDDLVEPGPADPVVPEPTDPSPPDSIVIPARSVSAEAAVLEKSNAFAWKLLPAAMAADPEANVLVSPLSASMALGMALNGARGTTYDQMRATLGFEDAPLDTVNLGYHGLMAHLPAADSTVSTQLANSAWYRDGFAVEQDFGEGAFAMTVLVPGARSSIDAELASMDVTRWQSLLDNLSARKVRVVLPRFRVEYDESLKPVLQALGTTDAFLPNVADFTGISAASPPLYISEVKQKTFVEVAEEGAEGAGTTSVGIGVTSLPPSVIANWPFVYLIRERKSSAILFAGVLRRPPDAG